MNDPSINRTFAADRLRELEEAHLRESPMTLKVRAYLEALLFKLGCFIERNCGIVILIGFVVMFVGSFGFTNVKIETDVEKLWVEVGSSLEEELQYTKKALKTDYGSSAELLIQTPRTEGTNILNVAAMKQHLEAVKKATKVTVKVHNRIWSLKDICYVPTLPVFYIGQIDRALRKLIPCVIVTPLDCFWDGAKLHGPDENISLGIENEPQDYRWTNLNPSKLLQMFKDIPQLGFFSEEDSIQRMFQEAGITTGYIEKPCLDPQDPECPISSPNKSKKKPDIGVELTGGCHGYAAKLMEWPEQLIVGGVTKNPSGTIRSAKAYQTIIQVMQASDLHAFWEGNNKKVGSVDWTLDAAKAVVKAWQHEFTKVINDNADDNNEYSILAFSSSSLNDLLEEFSQTSVTRLAMGYVFMLIYSCIALKRLGDAVYSQGALGFAGVLLVTLSVVSGLGFCSFVRISFNAASTQVLPFLALGLGVDDMFLLAHTYISLSEKEVPSPDHVVGNCLKRTGMTVLLTSFTNMFAFFMGSLIPIPALRAFSMQAAIIVIFNCIAVMTVFPAMIGVDVSRKDDNRFDFFCCWRSSLVRGILLTPNSRFSRSSSGSADIEACNANPESAQALGTICPPGAPYTIQATTHAEVNSDNRTARNVRDNTSKPDYTSTFSTRESNRPSDRQSVSATASASAHISGHCQSVAQIRMAGNDLASRESPDHRNPTGVFTPDMSERGCLHHHQSTCSHQNLPKRDLRGHRPSGFLSRDNPTTCRTVNEEGNACGRNVQFQMEAGAWASGDTAFAHSEVSSIHSTPSTRTHRVSPVRGHCLGHSPVLQDIPSSRNSSKWNSLMEKVDHLSLAHFARTHYGPWLQKYTVKIFVLFLFAGLFGASLYGSLQVQDGLDLSDVLPRSSKEHQFVEKQSEYFSFYRMVGVTKGGFDYAYGQDILYKYHKSFQRVSNILKTPEMELPRFWLMYFRDWLRGLQDAFDKDWSAGTITYHSYHDNASFSGVMAYKLLCQTGDRENPCNRAQVRSVKLVDDDGIIRPEVFYHYLSAWYAHDSLGYSSSQANIKPEPTSWKLFKHNKEDARIEPSLPINFSMVPFDLINLNETKDFVRTIKEVRAICTEFSEKHGLPNYPLGVVFTFWEQYIWLREHLLKAIMIVLVTSFLVMAVVLMNVWAAIIIVMFLIMITFEVFGFMGLWGIKLSAVPAVTLVLSVGVGVEFTVHMCTAFLWAGGDRNRRMQSAVEQVFCPIFAGGFSTFLGVVMLAGSEFDFIVRYFFHLLVALIVIGTMNGLVLLPVALSLIGPKSEVEETRPNTVSSGGSQGGLLPSSGCGRSVAPTDSELNILDVPETDTSESRRARHERQSQRGGSQQGRTNKTLPARMTTDSESSSIVIQATLTLKVRSEQVPAERSQQNAPPRTSGRVSTAVDDMELEDV